MSLHNFYYTIYIHKIKLMQTKTHFILPMTSTNDAKKMFDEKKTL